MTPVLVDSNILLDVITEDPRWGNWSRGMLARVADRRRMVINAIVLAEVSVRYSRLEEVDEVLSPEIFHREAIPFEAAFLAGKAFVAYRRGGGRRTSILPDFLVGAHAAVAGYSLLSRDVVRYRRYFPKVELISPS